MKNKQQGFTLPELLFVLGGVVWLAVVCTIVYVVIHFVAKFW